MERLLQRLGFLRLTKHEALQLQIILERAKDDLALDDMVSEFTGTISNLQLKQWRGIHSLYTRVSAIYGSN